MCLRIFPKAVHTIQCMFSGEDVSGIQVMNHPVKPQICTIFANQPSANYANLIPTNSQELF